MVNIGDVARHLGMSRSTVSYALSGKRRVSDETRRRVEEAVKELGFVPSTRGRALAGQGTRTLAALAPMGSNASPEVALQFVHGIAQASRAADYDVLLVVGDEAIHGVDRLLFTDRVDGLMLLDVERDDPRLASVRRAAKPTVLVGIPDDADGLHCVDLDWEMTGRILAEHLTERGHRQICLVAAPRIAHELGLAYAEKFQEGVVSAVRAAGAELLQIPAESTVAETMISLLAVLDDHPEITALVVEHEAITADIAPTLQRSGRRVPDDISVVGLSLDASDRAQSEGITGVDNPSRAITRAAVDRLLGCVEGAAVPAAVTLVEPVMVDRGSTRAH